MFRCPHCAQGYKLPLNQKHAIYNSRDMRKPIVTEHAKGSNFMRALCIANKVYTMKDGQKALNTDMRKEFYRSIMYVFQKNKEITCENCNHTHKYLDWSACYKDPFSFEFESSDLCFCGEEMMLDRLPNGRYGMYCDRCEQFSKNHQTVSSSGDLTAV